MKKNISFQKLFQIAHFDTKWYLSRREGLWDLLGLVNAYVSFSSPTASLSPTFLSSVAAFSAAVNSVATFSAASFLSYSTASAITSSVDGESFASSSCSFLPSFSASFSPSFSASSSPSLLATSSASFSGSFLPSPSSLADSSTDMATQNQQHLPRVWNHATLTRFYLLKFHPVSKHKCKSVVQFLCQLQLQLF